MKNNLAKRAMAVVLSIIVVLGLVPMTAMATEVTGGLLLDGTPKALEDGSGYELELSDGNKIMFYSVSDAKDPIASMNKTDYIRMCLQSTNERYLNVDGIALPAGESPANLWLYLGAEAQDQLGNTTANEKFKTQFDNVLNTYINGYNLGGTQSLSDGDNTYNVSSSGLQYATSMQSAGNDIAAKLFEYYRNANGTRSQDKAVGNNNCFNDSKEQDVFWSLISANKTSGKYKKGHYQAIAVIFSDFTLSPVLTSDMNQYTVLYVDKDNNTSPNKIGVTTNTEYTTLAVNGSRLPASFSNGYSASSTIATSSEVNGSKQYSFGQSIGAGFKFGEFAGLDISLDYGQAISSGWSKTESKEKSETYNQTLEGPIPPYSVVQVMKTEEVWNNRVTYDCPLALGYKVSIVEYTLDPSSNDAGAQVRALASFGTDSRTTLYQSVINEKGTDKIDWYVDAGAKAIAKKLATTMPYSVSGASVTTKTNKVTTIKLCEPSPYFPLVSVKAIKVKDFDGESFNELPLAIGGKLYLNEILLAGYNASGGEYCAFDQSKGEWVLLNDSGQEIEPGTSEAPAQLIKDPVSEEIYLYGQSGGSVYLKYKINENIYSSSTAPTEFATNASIETEIIKINVGASVTIGTPTFLESTVDHLVESTPANVVKDLLKTDVLNVFMDDPQKDYGCGIVEHVVYLSEEDARNHVNGQKLTQELIDANSFGNTFYVRAAVNNHYSEYVKVVLSKNPEATISYGEPQYDSELIDNTSIIVEDSFMDPASPVGGVDCDDEHTGGSATCTEKAVCSACGTAYGELAAHTYENGKCTVCKADDPNYKPPTTDNSQTGDNNPDSPQTGDNSHMALWIALLFISGGALIALNVYDRKRRTASKG